MIPNTSLLGKIVSLRLATVADAEAMLNAFEPESTQNLQFFSTAMSIQRQVEYLQQMYLSPTDVLFAIVENGSGRLVGTVGLHEIDTHIKNARIGLLIFRSSDRNRGFGNEATELLIEHAFRVLGLNKVYVTPFAEKVESQRHWTRLGFTVEDILREEYLLNGVYHDLVLMTMLAREWNASHA